MAWLLKRVLWRFASVESGEVYVTATGTTRMHLLSVDNWDIQQQVTIKQHSLRSIFDFEIHIFDTS